MSVSQTIAERLIGHAKGVAVDLLFPHVLHIEQTLTTQPSNDLVVNRWPSLPATTAATLARSLTDTETLDRVAAKEKRKTVRLELASNPNLHPVTRLFYIQEAARTHDHDLTRAALAGMGPLELLEYVTAEDPVARYVRFDNVARRIVKSDDVDSFREYTSRLTPHDVASFYESALQVDPVATLNLMQQVGVRPNRLELGRYVQIPAGNIDAWRYLYGIDPESVGPQVHRAFRDNPELLSEIDPSLVAGLLGSRRYDLSTVKTLVAHGLQERLMADKPRLDSEAADWLIEHTDEARTRTLVMLNHPDPAHSVQFIEDHIGFATTLSGSAELKAALNWLVQAASALGVRRSIDMLNVLLSTEENAGQYVHKDMINTLANRCSVSPDEFVAALDDDLFARISSLPELNDPTSVLDRAERLGGGLDVVVAESVLGHRSGDVQVQLRCVEIALSANRMDAMISWLVRSDDDMVRPVVQRHRSTLAGLVAVNRDLQRSSWAHELVDLVLPVGGWGSVRSSVLLTAAMDYLHRSIGEDRKVWEAVLVLFETWTGSLDDLVETARHL